MTQSLKAKPFAIQSEVNPKDNPIKNNNKSVNHKKILLAFSGGLDTSAIIPWLKENYHSEVIAYCSDLGNSPNGESLRKWALELGASDFIFEDLKDTFASRFVYPAIRASATYQDDYLLGTALGRPLIAERMAHFAKKLGATAISHGCTGKGNDQLRFERSWAYLVPDLEIIAPWRIWNFKGRSDLLAYLKEKGFELPSKEKVFSEDVNLLHRSCEGGILEEPDKEYDPKMIYKWVRPLSEIKALGQDPLTISVTLENGLPIAVNQIKMAPAELLSTLNEKVGACGIGVQDLVEERSNGIKSRGIYETPGGTLLHAAVKALKHLCWGRSLLTTARSLGQQYGESIYDGFWHTDLRNAMEAFFEKASETLSGTVTFKLEMGQMRFLHRTSEFSLYDTEAVTFEADQGGIHKLAEGYCKITALHQRQSGARDQKSKRTTLPNHDEKPGSKKI